MTCRHFNCFHVNWFQYQTCTMEKLIQIDSDYWNTYLSGSHGEDLYRYQINYYYFIQYNKSDICWPIWALCKSKRTYKKIIEANFVFSVTIEFCLQTHPRQSSRKWTTQLQWGCRCETVKYMKLNPCPRLQQEKYFHHQFCCRKWVILIYNWASSSTYFSCFIYKYIYIAYYILTAV